MSSSQIDHQVDDRIFSSVKIDETRKGPEIVASYYLRDHPAWLRIAEVRVQLKPSDLAGIIETLIAQHNEWVRFGKVEGPEVELVEKRPLTPPASAKWEFDILSPVYADDDESAEALVADLDRAGVYYERSEIVRRGE